MEPNNRPQGRRKTVSGDSLGTARRGSGLNTGPVGSGSRPQSGQTPRPGAARPRPEAERPAANRQARGGRGLSPIAVIAVLLMLLFGGKSMLFPSQEDTTSGYPQTQQSYTQSQSQQQSQTQHSQSQSGSGLSNFANFFSDAGFAGQSASSDVGSVNTDSSRPDGTVASGARAKRTQILGGGADHVTVMVYLCGTDLESRSAMATKDLQEMTRANLGSNVEVLVYTGGCTNWNNNVVSAKTNQIYQIRNGGLKCLVSDAGSVSMTKPDTLSGFIRWCAENYPANRYELILWDHGGGSVSGYGYDQKFPRSGSMTLAGIRSALEDAGVTFDIIGFDACLMATTETALMLEPYGDYLLASEETEPGIGWYYTDWLTKLGSNPGMASLQIGRNIADDFVSTCANQCRGQSATLSLVDLAELSHTLPATLRAFSLDISKQVNSGEYRTVSTARSGSREFARSTAIDQIDLTDFALRLGSEEGKKLASAVRGAVKYNRCSSNMTNAYGLSIYFPYRKLSQVDKAVSAFDAVGMDSSYAQCIRDFASLEAGGQAVSGGTASPFDALFGSLYGGSSGGGFGSYGGSSGSSYGTGSSTYGSGSGSSSYGSAFSGSYGGSSSASYETEILSALLGSFFGGDSYGGLSGLSGSNNSFLFGRTMSTEDTVAYLSDNHFDPDALRWEQNAAGETVLSLPEDQWALVEELELNLYYDDGEGYIDLGLDNVFDFDEQNRLLAPTDRTWLAVNGQPVAYYHDTTSGADDSLVITGHIPVLLNGERAELLVVFDADNPEGAVTGARRIYLDGETDTQAKSVIELEEGDTLDFLCDYYRYDGSYENSYFLGEQMEVGGELRLSNVDVGDGAVSLCYRFTDLYQQHYWTPALVLEHR